MVAGKNAVSSGAEAFSVGSKTTVKTAKTKKNGDADFKTMLDKNAQSAQNTQGTQGTQGTQNTGANAETPKADAAEKAPENSTAVPEKEEMTEENGMELQVLAQLIAMPGQERAALNWAEEAPAEAAVETAAVESVGNAAEAAAQTGAYQADTHATLTEDNAGLSGQETDKAADNGADTAKAAQKQDAGEVRQADVVKDVKVQGAAETERDGAAERVDAKAWAEDTQGAAKEETETVQDAAAYTAAPKAVQEDGMMRFKVGEAVALSEPEAAENIAETILVRVGEDNREFEMQLNPEELGTVKIKMVFEEGKVHIAMTCDNQKAMDLLSSTSSKLKELIEERTGSEVSVHVSEENETPYHEQEKQRDGRENTPQENHKQGANSGAEPADFIQQLRLGLVEAE